MTRHLPAPWRAEKFSGGYVVRDPSLPSLYGRYVYSDSGDGGPGAIRSETSAPSPSGAAVREWR